MALAYAECQFEVDVLQWRPGWVPTPEDEFARLHDAILECDAWILDGFGPWAAIEKRFDQADTIILVDHPLWVHFWWAAERQIACATGAEREGGPKGCPLPPMTGRLFKLIWDLHHETRPRLLEMIERRRATHDVYVIQSFDF